MKIFSGLVGWLGIVFVAAWVGSRSMPGEWYASLTKPSELDTEKRMFNI